MRITHHIILALLTVIALTSGAFAANGTGYLSASQTLSHCGYIPVAQKDYASTPRNVSIIQEKLLLLGYDLGPHGIDGRYGKDTRAAMRHFQADLGLKQDGVAGPETVMVLAYESHPAPNVQRCRTPYVLITR